MQHHFIRQERWVVLYSGLHKAIAAALFMSMGHSSNVHNSISATAMVSDAVPHKRDGTTSVLALHPCVPPVHRQLPCAPVGSEACTQP